MVLVVLVDVEVEKQIIQVQKVEIVFFMELHLQEVVLVELKEILDLLLEQVDQVVDQVVEILFNQVEQVILQAQLQVAISLRRRKPTWTQCKQSPASWRSSGWRWTPCSPTPQTRA